MASARSGSVQTHINAGLDEVWALLADIERMSEWSPECYRVEWLDGACSPAQPGARFQGWNRYDQLEWSIECRVKSAVPGAEISWATLADGREMTTWTYRLTPSGDGVDVVESFDVAWYSPQAGYAEDVLMQDRDERRLAGMRLTLQRIKELAEGATETHAA